MPKGTHGGQRTSFWSLFSPSGSVWGPIQVIRFSIECLYPQNHLTSLQPGFQEDLPVIQLFLTEAWKKYTATEHLKRTFCLLAQ